MQETGFDMWLIICNEDNLDPVFETMIPFNCWAPIAQILVIYDPRKGTGLERLNISRTDMLGFYEDAWVYGAWDTGKSESQWDCLKRIVRYKDPRRSPLTNRM
jgi:hypothetical protein